MQQQFNGPDPGLAPPPQQVYQAGPPHQAGPPPVQVQQGGGQSRENGVVVRINGNKGYGFIRRENGQEIFFHTRSIRNASDIRLLREEDRVEFQIGFDPKNPSKEEAQEVRVLEDVSYRAMIHPQPGSFGRGAAPGPPGGYGRGYDPYTAHAAAYGGAPQTFGGYGVQTQRHSPYGPPAPYGMPAPPVAQEGPIKSLNRERQYGFVNLRGESLFFPRSQLITPEFDELKEGDVMTFVVIPDPRMPDKWMASQVRRAYEKGTIDGLKDHYGFINTDSGERVFFHGRYVQGCSFNDLTDGARVEFKLVPSRKGGRRTHERGSVFEAQELKLIPNEQPGFKEEPSEGNFNTNQNNPDQGAVYKTEEGAGDNANFGGMHQGQVQQ